MEALDGQRLGVTNPYTILLLASSHPITQPVQELAHKSAALLPCQQCLRQEIGTVEVRADVRRPPLVPGAALENEVIGEAVHLLLQRGTRHFCVSQ